MADDDVSALSGDGLVELLSGLDPRAAGLTNLFDLPTA